MCRLVVCEKPAPLAERFTQDGALGEGRMRQDQLHGQTQPKGADNELLFPSTGKRQQASWRAYHSGEVRETTLETPQIDEYTLPLDLVGLHEGRRKMSVFTILGDASSAATAAEDEFRDSGLCPNRKPSSPDASLNLLQLMTATDCSSHVGRCASGGDLGRANCQWQTDTSVSCPVSVGAALPFSSSLVMEATSGSGSSTSSGKQKQKTASESSSGSGGGGGASSSSSQPRSQRGGRRGGLGSESSDSDDNDDDERKRRPPRDLKKEPKSKVDFPDDDDEATDSADEGADPVIDCDPLSNSSRAGVVGTSSEVGEEEQRVSRDDGGGSVTSTVTIESKEVISLSSPRLASPVNMAVGYGVLDAMPPRVIDKDSPESTLAGTPILDSPRLLQDIPSASHTPLMSPEVVCVSQTSTSVPAITSAARNRTGLTIGAVQPSPSLAGPSFNLPFETTWGWQPPVYSPFPLTAGSHPGSIANTPAATDPGGFLRAGAPVFLQGTVCQESDGVLIISVRWRNRMFSGSLIDTGQHEWAPPRLSCGFSDQLVKVKDLCSQQEAENQPVNVDVEEVEPKENPSSESNEVEITGVDTKSDTTESATEQGPELEQLEETEMESMETEAEAPPTEPANSAITKTKLPEAMETTSSKISSPSLRQSLTVPVQKTEQPDNTHFSDISDASDGETECLEDGERAVQPRPSASTLLPLQLTMGQPRSINGILPVLGGPRVEEKKSSSDQQKLQLVSPTPPLPDFAAINARSPAERREKEEGRHRVPQKPTSRKASGDGMEDMLPDSKGPPQLHPPQVESSAAILRSTLLNYLITTSSQPSAVTTVSVPVEQESKRLFDEAMKHGYVEARLTVLLLIGAAGAGKTHAKHLFLGLPPPLVRQSTPLAEEAIRAMSTLRAMVSGTSDLVWNPVTLEQLKQMIAEAVKAARLKKQQASLTNASLPPGEPNGSTQDPSPPSLKADGSESASLDASLENEQDQELIDLIASSEGSNKLFEVDWVYLVDSGGQPSFHELLPLFIRIATAVAFVLKLSEYLSHKPTLEYYGKDGRRCGSSYSSPLTNEQILRHCFRSLQSRQCLSSDATRPNIFVIGTHRDCEHRCKETRREKNSKLLEMLRPCFDENIAYYRVTKPEEIIYPVNAKAPTDEDEKVAEQFRKEVTRMGGEVRVKIPLPWFVLEQYLQRLVAEKRRKVLTTGECEHEANRLHMNWRACEAALEYLDKLNMFFYRPDYLKGLVLCGSQLWLDKITELIELMHSLHGQSQSSVVKASPDHWLRKLASREFQPGSHTQTPASDPLHDIFDSYGTECLKFRDYGIVTVKILKKFPRHYVEGLFTPTELLKLLTAFLVTAPISEGSPEYVMPCLLRELAPQELDKHHQLDPSSPAAALVIQFPDNWVPAGIFTVLTSYLRNVAHWQLCLSSGNPSCLYRNCVEFDLPTGHGGSVTLVDSFQYLEIYVVEATAKTCGKACPRIAHDIFNGIEEAARRLHYDALTAKTAFFCLSPSHACSPAPHLANVVDDDWVCSVNRKISGELTSQHQVWLEQKTLTGALATGFADTPTVASRSPTTVTGASNTPNSTGTTNSVSTPVLVAGTTATPSALSGDQITIANVANFEGIPTALTRIPTASHTPTYPAPTDNPTADPRTVDRPTMKEVVRFRGRHRRINLTQEIGVRYRQFGYLLLDDRRGARVQGIVHHLREDPELITMEILQQWIGGRGLLPVTWATLVEVLKDIDLVNLAEDIAEIKL